MLIENSQVTVKTYSEVDCVMRMAMAKMRERPWERRSIPCYQRRI